MALAHERREWAGRNETPARDGARAATRDRLPARPCRRPAGAGRRRQAQKAGPSGSASYRAPGRSRRPTGAAAPSSPSRRSEEHTSELQSLMRISYAVFCLKKKINLTLTTLHTVTLTTTSTNLYYHHSI